MCMSPKLQSPASISGWPDNLLHVSGLSISFPGKASFKWYVLKSLNQIFIRHHISLFHVKGFGWAFREGQVSLPVFMKEGEDLCLPSQLLWHLAKMKGHGLVCWSAVEDFDSWQYNIHCICLSGLHWFFSIVAFSDLEVNHSTGHFLYKNNWTASDLSQKLGAEICFLGCTVFLGHMNMNWQNHVCFTGLQSEAMQWRTDSSPVQGTYWSNVGV